MAKPVAVGGKPTLLPPTEVPTTANRGQLTSALVALGYRGTDLAAIVRAGATRQAIADALIAAQRLAPKA